MLYKNDELWNVEGNKEWKAIKEKLLTEWFKKGKMVIKMPDFFYTKSEGNTKPDRPATATIPLIVLRNDDNGSVRWNYCTGRDKQKDNWIYYFSAQGARANVITYTDSMTITKEQVDLAYFLLYLSPLRYIPGESHESMIARGCKPNQRFQYVIENKEAESALKLNQRDQRRKIENAIMDEELGLPMDKIRLIAASMHIGNAEEKGELELKDELLTHVERLQFTGKNGYAQFMQLSKLDKVTGIRAAVQKAIDMKLIKENHKTKSMVYVREGKEANTITSVIGPRTIRESTEFYLEQNPGAFDELLQEIKEKELVAESV